MQYCIVTFFKGLVGGGGGGEGGGEGGSRGREG